MGPRRVICGYCGLRFYYGGIHWLWRLWGVMSEGKWFVGIGINRDIEIVINNNKIG